MSIPARHCFLAMVAALTLHGSPWAAPAAAIAPEAAALSAAARSTYTHIVSTRDHGQAPFAILDKPRARLWLYDRDGQALGDTPVLLGFARGDESAPGIGDRAIEAVRPHERTTPAGRFKAEHGLNARGEQVLWIDYDAAVSMHRAIRGHATERRPQRMASPTPADNRISYGCVNVPADFFDRLLLPVSKVHAPVIYVLPETRPWSSIFQVKATAGSTAGTPAAVSGR